MPPRGGQLCPYVLISSFGMFQYMPPRGGQHGVERGWVDIDSVSIHAPTRGATR